MSNFFLLLVAGLVTQARAALEPNEQMLRAINKQQHQWVREAQRRNNVLHVFTRGV
jgi:hypothetical protein